MTNDEIPDGPFTEAHPMREHCGSTEEHPAHKDSRVQETWRGPQRWWRECPGWETTHVLTLTEPGGRVVGEQRLDLRGRLEYTGSTNDPLLALLYEAREAGRPRPPDDELLFGIAGAYVAPEVCPYDSDRCHEHLYGLAEELEGEE